MAEVYVLQQGYYSDKEIVAVFSSKELLRDYLIKHELKLDGLDAWNEERSKAEPEWEFLKDTVDFHTHEHHYTKRDLDPL